MARAAAVGLTVLVAVAIAGHPTGAQARVTLGWQLPVQLAAPVPLDVFGAQAAVSAQGTGAVGYGVTDIDNPVSSTAFTLTRTSGGSLLGPNQVPGVKQVLALAWEGRTETVLTGTADATQTCCSAAQTSQATGRGLHSIVTGLADATEGRLIPVAGRLLAVVGTERGVWAAQSDAHGRFGSTHKLAGSAVIGALDAVAVSQNRTVTGWATTASPAIWIARGSANVAPRSAQRVISVPSGRSIDEFELAPAPTPAGGATAVWIETWNDSRDAFHSVVMTADLTGAPSRRQLSSSRELAAGLAVAGDAVGDQAIAWKRCDSTGACALRATLRVAGARFGAVQRLPAIDASEVPALAVSVAGEAVLGWTQNGHVLAADAPLGVKRFSSAHTVSSTIDATDLGIAFGPASTALATWTQGTPGEAVMGAVYVGR